MAIWELGRACLAGACKRACRGRQARPNSIEIKLGKKRREPDQISSVFSCSQREKCEA